MRIRFVPTGLLHPVRNFTLLLPIMLMITLAAGCTTTKGSHYDISQATSVDLKTANYIVLKSSAIGTDSGFKLLGIPIVYPSYIEAINDLRSKAPMENRATALANVVQEETSTWYLLFSIPRIRVSADIIEFTRTNEAK